MRKQRDSVRGRWASRPDAAGRDERPATLYAAARRRPLSAAADVADRLFRERTLGPYETTYDVAHGYGVERTIIRP